MDTKKGDPVKYLVFSVLSVSFLIGGCGNVREQPPSGMLRPPQVAVIIGSQQIQTVVNGYQWSNGNNSAIAVATMEPAKNLKKYDASRGEKVFLSFEQTPNSTWLTMWSNGKEVSEFHLNGTSFTLPTQPGDYSYEITGNWGINYVNYDFELQIHESGFNVTSNQ